MMPACSVGGPSNITVSVALLIIIITSKDHKGTHKDAPQVFKRMEGVLIVGHLPWRCPGTAWWPAQQGAPAETSPEHMSLFIIIIR